MSAEKQALLKQKTELNQEKKLELQDERKKRAAEFIVKLKKTDEGDEPSAGRPLHRLVLGLDDSNPAPPNPGNAKNCADDL